MFTSLFLSKKKTNQLVTLKIFLIVSTSKDLFPKHLSSTRIIYEIQNSGAREWTFCSRFREDGVLLEFSPFSLLK